MPSEVGNDGRTIVPRDSKSQDTRQHKEGYDKIEQNLALESILTTSRMYNDNWQLEAGLGVSMSVECEETVNEIYTEKKKIVNPNRCSWTEENKARAVKALKDDKVPLSTAAKTFSVPRNTLRLRTDIQRAPNSSLSICFNGLKHPFNNEAEMVGKEWVRGFLIYKTQKVISQRGKRDVVSQTNCEKGETVSVMACVSAAGHYVPPLFVKKEQRQNDDYEIGMPPELPHSKEVVVEAQDEAEVVSPNQEPACVSPASSTSTAEGVVASMSNSQRNNFEELSPITITATCNAQTRKRKAGESRILTDPNFIQKLKEKNEAASNRPKRRNKRVGETGDLQENPPSSGIDRHRSPHAKILEPMRKSWSDPTGNRTRFALVVDDYKDDDINSNQEILTSDNALSNALCSVVPK
ncbi:hypothetical protein PR048_027643 [Dryococelus australis]|uniref:HTH psq-type domain-containing protein n=1 Tax=Dryococelus australis TaxID=614101 RepID=A0ABQ9GH21_9NEOP|nr:hypothetical protein PR048_027643 [Dryococelus australis]